MYKYIVKVNGNPIQSFWRFSDGIIKKLELRKLNPKTKVTMLELKITAEKVFASGGMLPRLSQASQNNLALAEERIKLKEKEKAEAQTLDEVAAHYGVTDYPILN